MSTYSNHVYELYWDLRSSNDNLAERNNKTQLMDGKQQVLYLLVTPLDGCKRTFLPCGLNVLYIQPTPEQAVVLFLKGYYTQTHTRIMYVEVTEKTRKYCGVFVPCEGCWAAEVCGRGDYATVRKAVFSPCRAEPDRARC
jgi:hypothetical protein